VTKWQKGGVNGKEQRQRTIKRGVSAYEIERGRENASRFSSGLLDGPQGHVETGSHRRLFHGQRHHQSEDLSQAKTPGFTVWPAGGYNVRCTISRKPAQRRKRDETANHGNSTQPQDDTTPPRCRSRSVPPARRAHHRSAKGKEANEEGEEGGGNRERRKTRLIEHPVATAYRNVFAAPFECFIAASPPRCCLCPVGFHRCRNIIPRSGLILLTDKIRAFRPSVHPAPQQFRLRQLPRDLRRGCEWPFRAAVSSQPRLKLFEQDYIPAPSCHSSHGAHPAAAFQHPITPTRFTHRFPSRSAQREKKRTVRPSSRLSPD